jgi:hypothetical protein
VTKDPKTKSRYKISQLRKITTKKNREEDKG